MPRKMRMGPPVPQAGHTPGPWKLIKPGHGHPTNYLSVQIGSDELYSTIEMVPADAYLVAAAPDLLAACLSARKAMNQLGIVGDPAQFDLDAAIAKATGNK